MDTIAFCIMPVHLGATDMTDAQIQSGMKALAARIVALEARVAELESAPARSTRKPKDVAEVAEYFKRHGLNGTADSEARRFFAFYDSKGWKVGKSPMVKWRSAAANWIEGKVQVEDAKPRKPQANVDYWIKVEDDGARRYWIRDGAKTAERFTDDAWREEVGLV